MLGALALVPFDKLEDGLRIIRSCIPKDENNQNCKMCLNLLSYFLNQWTISNLKINILYTES